MMQKKLFILLLASLISFSCTADTEQVDKKGIIKQIHRSYSVKDNSSRKQIYDSAYKLFPNDKSVLAELASAYRDIGEFDKENEIFDKMLNMAKEEGDVNSILLIKAARQLNHGDTNGALEYANKAVETAKSDFEKIHSLYVRIGIYGTIHDYKSVIYDYNQALEVIDLQLHNDPSNSELLQRKCRMLINKACAFTMLQDYDNIIAELNFAKSLGVMEDGELDSMISQVQELKANHNTASDGGAPFKGKVSKLIDDMEYARGNRFYEKNCQTSEHIVNMPGETYRSPSESPIRKTALGDYDRHGSGKLQHNTSINKNNK